MHSKNSSEAMELQRRARTDTNSTDDSGTLESIQSDASQSKFSLQLAERFEKFSMMVAYLHVYLGSMSAMKGEGGL